MDSKSDSEMRAACERKIRHMEACNASDIKHLRDSLSDAASRLSDLADIIEKDRTYDPVGFMRASAERYRLAAEGKS